MPSDHEPTPEDMIAKLILAAGFLMEETNPEHPTPIVPTRDPLEARMAVVGRAAVRPPTAGRCSMKSMTGEARADRSSALPSSGCSPTSRLARSISWSSTRSTG
jgi:hypothetical protein